MCVRVPFDHPASPAPAITQVGRSRFYSLVHGIAKGMEFVHARGCVHRDLKPDNVLLSAQDVVKLCDFGLSRNATTEATMMTAGVGTPAYMAVELITGDSSSTECSNTVDVFSMGVLMWSLWTHEVPYAKETFTPFMLMNKLVSGLRPEVPEDVPPRLAALMASCWQEEPFARPSFSEVCAVLREVAEAAAQELVVAVPYPAPADAKASCPAVPVTAYTPPTVLIAPSTSTPPPSDSSDGDDDGGGGETRTRHGTV